MKRSRLVVIAAGSVLGLGLALALGALVLDPARAAVGPLPPEGLVLPADTRFVMGLDVHRFVQSPFYAKFASQGGRPQAFTELEQKTGFNPERDVDQVLIAGRPDKGRQGGLVIVRGRFDRYKLSQAIESGGKQVTTKKHEGNPLYVFNEGQASASAVAFLGHDDDLLVMGSQASVEAAVSSHFQGGTPLKQNTALVSLLERVKPGSTFWMVGDQSLLSQMPSTVPAPGGGSGGAQLQLPALKALMVTGELEPVVSVDVTGDAADAAGASQLADIVRGFVALASLQAAQKPELKGLQNAVSVTTEQASVRLSARLPYELLEALQPKKSAGVSPAPAPAR
jgi:hypothetical protein